MLCLFLSRRPRRTWRRPCAGLPATFLILLVSDGLAAQRTGRVGRRRQSCGGFVQRFLTVTRAYGLGEQDRRACSARHTGAGPTGPTRAGLSLVRGPGTCVLGPPLGSDCVPVSAPAPGGDTLMGCFEGGAAALIIRDSARDGCLSFISLLVRSFTERV